MSMHQRIRRSSFVSSQISKFSGRVPSDAYAAFTVIFKVTLSLGKIKCVWNWMSSTIASLLKKLYSSGCRHDQKQCRELRKHATRSILAMSSLLFYQNDLHLPRKSCLKWFSKRVWRALASLVFAWVMPINFSITSISLSTQNCRGVSHVPSSQGRHFNREGATK